MAGRVERRVSDKFYFVLDEVGSSGADSESDDETMSSSKEAIGDNSEKLDRVSTEEDGQSTINPKPTGNEHNSVDNNSGEGYESDGEVRDSTTCVQSDSQEGCTSDNGHTDEKSQEERPDQASGMCHNSEVVEMDIDNGSDDGSIHETIQPIIKISFRDEKIESAYKSSILKYLCRKIPPCTIVNGDNSLEVEIYLDESALDQGDDNEVLDFQLDTTPSCDSYSNRVPSYGKNHDILLTDSNSDQPESPKHDVAQSGNVCFNCCGNHVLRDCPHERNLKQISQNRLKFQMNRMPSQKNSRYHLDENQRFSHLVPGEISKKLRNALDLRKDQQPEFIYRMRRLGYPPAWLEEARVSHSGVVIYDSKGVPILEEGDEEEEIIEEGAKDRFDISKIIEFPGFNVPLPKNMKEEGKFYNCPGMSDSQSKENMIKTLEPNAVQAYRKRTLALTRYSSQEDDSEDIGKNSSPTIEEMEERKRQLLMALDDVDDTAECKGQASAATAACDQDASSSSSCVEPEVTAESVEPVAAETPVKDDRTVRNLEFGTPVLKSISPYSKIPSREQFSLNVSDVINFENLPNSTGKYEAMSNLILKIRNTVSKMQNE